MFIRVFYAPHEVDSFHGYRYNAKRKRDEWKIRWRGSGEESWEPLEKLPSKGAVNKAKIVKTRAIREMRKKEDIKEGIHAEDLEDECRIIHELLKPQIKSQKNAQTEAENSSLTEEIDEDDVEETGQTNRRDEKDIHEGQKRESPSKSPSPVETMEDDGTRAKQKIDKKTRLIPKNSRRRSKHNENKGQLTRTKPESPESDIESCIKEHLAENPELLEEIFGGKQQSQRPFRINDTPMGMVQSTENGKAQKQAVEGKGKAVMTGGPASSTSSSSEDEREWRRYLNFCEGRSAQIEKDDVEQPAPIIEEKEIVQSPAQNQIETTTTPPSLLLRKTDEKRKATTMKIYDRLENVKNKKKQEKETRLHIHM